MSEILDLNHSKASEADRRSAFRRLVPDMGVWEFINGEVRQQPPFRVRELRAEGNLRSLLHCFARSSKVGESGGGKMLVATRRNDFMPDAWFLGPEKASRLTPETEIVPTPDFVAEIVSPETEAMDRGVKRDDFAANGVREYWLVDAVREEIGRCVLALGVYQDAEVFREGEIAAVTLPGFTIPVRALFDEEVCLQATRRLLNLA